MASNAIVWIAVLSFAAPQAPRAITLAAPVRLECDQGLIDSGAFIGHSGPLFADFDGDKKPDLLVGNFKGNLQLYKNVGEIGQPKFVAKGLLKAAGVDAHAKNW
jgi:hypothetical protein